MRTFPYLLKRVLRPATLGMVLAMCLAFGITKALADTASTTDTSTTTTTTTTSDTGTTTDTGTAAQSTASSSPDTTAGGATTSQSLSATSTSSAATSTATTTTTWVKCNMAYTADLYDTPSGHLDTGYALATSSDVTGPTVAHIVGSQSWADCRDNQGNRYETRLTPQQYVDLGNPTAPMQLNEYIALPAAN